MIVLGDCKCFEAALPDVPLAARSIMLVITAHMGGHEPHHVSAEIRVVLRPCRQMKMVWHQAVAQKSNRNALTRLLEQLDKGVDIGLFMEYGLATVPSVQNVVTVTGSSRSCGAWHNLI